MRNKKTFASDLEVLCLTLAYKKLCQVKLSVSLNTGEISDLSQDCFVNEDETLAEHGSQEKEDNGSESWVHGYKTVFWELFMTLCI